MLPAVWKKNDKKARSLIVIFSIIVFAAVSILGRYNLSGKVDLPFDVHLFALANAIINGTVAILLLTGLFIVKRRNYLLHADKLLFKYSKYSSTLFIN